MDKRAIVLLIGSVSSSQYKEARLKVLSEGHKPVIVRVSDKTIEVWLEEMNKLDLDEVGEKKFSARATWLDKFLPEGLTRRSIRAVVTAPETSLSFAIGMSVSDFIEWTFPNAKKVTHWSVDLEGFCNPT